MKISTTALMLIGALALTACNNPNRFGAGAGGMGAGGGAGALGPNGIDMSALGDPNNPDSLAHFQQVIGDRVLFAVDQSTLSPEARAILAAQATWLNARPQVAVIIEGHADEQGTREYNLALGARRASAVQEFLISQGIAANRIRTVSYGKERPLEVCSDEACYSKNRRAVTVITAAPAV